MENSRHRSIELMIAGAQKAGTTSLKEYLGQHPQICTHPQREFAFFAVESLYQQGYDAIYERYFNYQDHHHLILAKNVDVMYDTPTITRLQNHNSNIQIVLMLRNPVDRAYSAYWYAIRTGRETLPTFEEAITLSSDRHGDDIISKWGCDYLVRGEYYFHIKNLYKYFLPEQVHIFLFEDLVNNSKDVCQRIYELFDYLDIEFSPNTIHKTNPSALSKNRLVADMVYSPGKYPILKTIIRTLLPGKYTDRVRDQIIKLNETRFTPPPIDPETRQHLIKYFKPYNQQLEDLLGRDLSHWDADNQFPSSKTENP